jgi:hypothetical protein
VHLILTFPEVKGGVALLGCVEVALGLPRLGQQEAAILFLVHETAANIRRTLGEWLPKTSARGAICRMADYPFSDLCEKDVTDILKGTQA